MELPKIVCKCAMMPKLYFLNKEVLENFYNNIYIIHYIMHKCLLNSYCGVRLRMQRYHIDLQGISIPSGGGEWTRN